MLYEVDETDKNGEFFCDRKKLDVMNETNKQLEECRAASAWIEAMRGPMTTIATIPALRVCVGNNTVQGTSTGSGVCRLPTPQIWEQLDPKKVIHQSLPLSDRDTIDSSLLLEDRLQSLSTAARIS